MSNVSIKFNENGIRQMMAEAQKKLEQQANKMLQDRAWSVNERMKGKPVDEIYTVLEREVRADFAGSHLTLNVPNLRRVAQAISDGELAR